MFDTVSRQHVPQAEYILHRFQRRLCDICIWIHKSEPRVFIGGGEYGYDGTVREADVVEIEALQELYGIKELGEIAVRRKINPLPIDRAVTQPPV